MPAVLIRPFRPEDTDALYRVALHTGNDGTDASGLFADPDLIGHLYVGPYLALEPALAWSLVDETGPIGYVLGALDTVDFERRCEQHWWPPLRARIPDPSIRPDWPGLESASQDDEAAYLIHHPELTPAEVLPQYPSHLHIDLLPSGQGQGYGRTMIDTLLATLIAAGSPGVHLGVGAANVRAIGFYRALGFRELRRDPTEVYLGRTLGQQAGASAAPRPAPDGGSTGASDR